jgi:N-acetylmuramoyl-L-alanine amidase
VKTEVKVAGRYSRWLTCIAVAALLLTSLPAFADANTNSANARDAAETQFDHAQTQRATLEATPESYRSLIQYQDLVKAYRRVYLLSASAKDVPLAIMTVADLNRKMGDLFDPKFYRAAIDAYQYLLHDYPTCRYREDALFATGQIEKDNLHDAALAQKTFEEFLGLHPRSAHAADARAALAQLTSGSQPGKKSVAAVQAAPPPAKEPASAASQSAGQKPVRNVVAANDSAPPSQLIFNQALTQIMEPPTPGKVSEIHDIKTWTTPDYTRIVINLDGPIKYHAGRAANPERIYFDVNQARLGRGVTGPGVQIQGDLLKNVRIAPNSAGVVRVVLEVGRIKDYSVFLLRDPYRMVIDIYAKPDPFSSTISAKNSAPPQNPAQQSAAKKNTANKDVAVKTPPPVTDTAANAPQASQQNSNHESAQEQAADQALAADIAKREANSMPTGAIGAAASSATIPSGAYAYGPPAPAPSKANYLKAGNNSGAKLAPSPTPDRPRDGQQSLSRALGLKVGRIVIDAGHGGHDTGTIGPNGLMEKDLCLDVALRLGQMIEDHLPGAEVVYTRSDDTFVPLEERTNIANNAKADLFISIHANSSPDPTARGVETYYLNFSPSPEAMDVAARENATAQNNVHDLESLIQRIARNEKIEESRELAADIQDSLSKRLERTSKNIRNRGVRKAPFVVLIGANMPSVLAEISFISNPADEVALAKPDGRDHVAEGLYKGIEAYLQSTNSLAANQTKPLPNGSSSALAHSGNQR